MSHTTVTTSQHSDAVLTARTTHDIRFPEHTPDLSGYRKVRRSFFYEGSFLVAVVEKAIVSTRKVTLERVYSRDTIARTTDGVIVTTLGDDFCFEEYEVATLIHKLLYEQASGGTGMLRNDGEANLFYVSSGVISVRWGTKPHPSWRVFLYGFDILPRKADSRIFSRN